MLGHEPSVSSSQAWSTSGLSPLYSIGSGCGVNDLPLSSKAGAPVNLTCSNFIYGRAAAIICKECQKQALSISMGPGEGYRNAPRSVFHPVE
jgi:hypothetical protein